MSKDAFQNFRSIMEKNGIGVTKSKRRIVDRLHWLSLHDEETYWKVATILFSIKDMHLKKD